MIPIGGFSVSEEFASISASDGMLVFGLSRSNRSANQVGAKIVFVTDYAGQPLPKIDAVVLRCRTVGATVFDSLTAAVSLMTYLCSGLATNLGETSIERLRRIEDIHNGWSDGVEADW